MKMLCYLLGKILLFPPLIHVKEKVVFETESPIQEASVPNSSTTQEDEVTADQRSP